MSRSRPPDRPTGRGRLLDRAPQRGADPKSQSAWKSVVGTALCSPLLRCMSLLLACAVKRRRFPVGASPTRQPLQPEATGAVMEVTKWLKPSD